MATAVTVTVWEAEELAECVRCGESMTVYPVVHGIELGHGVYLCGVCFFYIYDGSKAQALAALGLELGASDDDDGDGPDGDPAAPALAPVALAVSAARSARPFTHLSELSPAEQAEYEAWAAEVAAELPDPVPCAQCGRPASPYEETPAGPLCFRCWGPRTGPARTAALVAC